mmetsp:Transcript_53309/g.130193  ORF Transcript_53309/g.130193 Transcript_53309/m.130193 type:complete len:255 (+) Transcript_53309:79-843(+)
MSLMSPRVSVPEPFFLAPGGEGGGTTLLSAFPKREKAPRMSPIGLPPAPSRKFAMRANEAAVSDAPPTRHPSMSALDSSSSTLSGVTLPPYWIRTPSATPCPNMNARCCLMNLCTSCALFASHTSPVPMAHTGSYAMVTRRISSRETPLRHLESCTATMCVLRPSSYSSRVSPTHTSGCSPSANALRTCLLMNSSVAPKTERRSEWPMRTCLQPTERSMEPETAPVYAPEVSVYMFCAPSSTTEPRVASAATGR